MAVALCVYYCAKSCDSDLSNFDDQNFECKVLILISSAFFVVVVAFFCWGKSNVCKVCTNPNAASKIVKDFHIFVQIKDTHSTVSASSRFIEYVFIRLYNIWCKLNIWLILVLIIYKF